MRLSLLGGPLALDYDGWPMSTSVVPVLPYALPLLALLLATIWGVLRRRAWAFPAVVWFATLAPSSSVLPLATEIAAERRMYVPLAAFIVLLVAGGFELGRRLIDRWTRDAALRRMLGRTLGAAAIVALATLYGAETYARNQDFWSVERIWQDTASKRPANSRARLNYGVSLIQIGRTADAEGQLREAVRLKDTNAAAHLNLGSLLASRGRTEEGIAHLERALALDPSYVQAYRNLGEAYGTLGNHRQAARYFQLAVGHDSSDPFLLNRAAWLLATSPDDSVRNGERAVALAELAVQRTSREDPVSLDTLAAALAETGRFAAAIAAAREAIDTAGRTGRSEMVPILQARLAGYQAGHPYRER